METVLTWVQNVAAPKKLQNIPDRPEFEGRDVYKHTVGYDKEATLAKLNKLGETNPNDLRIHAGGYYSVLKKSKKNTK